MIDPAGKGLVFLLGIPRSGTTLLASMLDRHPALTAPPEPWIMLALERLHQAHPRHPADARALGTAVSAFLDRELALAVSRAAALAAYNGWLARTGAAVFIDKTPRYHLILDHLREVFPAAVFLWLCRNPLDVAASYRSTWASDLPRLIAAGADTPDLFDLLPGLDRLERFHRAHPGAVLKIAYEDLVTDTAGCLRSVLQRIGVEHAAPTLDGMMDLRRPSRPPGSFGDPKIFSTTAPHRASVGRWAGCFDADELRCLADAIGRDRLVRLGYAGVVDELQRRGVPAGDPARAEAHRTRAEALLAARWDEMARASTLDATPDATPDATAGPAIDAGVPSVRPETPAAPPAAPPPDAPTPADALRLGVQLHGKGLLRDAARIYREVLSGHPGNANAWHLLGLAALQDGALGPAEHRIRRALALAPFAAEYWNNAGILLHRTGDVGGAIRAQRRALDLRPGFPEGLNNYGSLLHEAGRPQDAASVFAKAVALSPGYAEALNNLGLALLESGPPAARNGRALAAFRRALALRPDQAAHHVNVANATLAAGHGPAACLHYAGALARNPLHKHARRTLATTLRETGRPAAALAQARILAALFPDDAASCALLAAVSPQAGEARRHLLRARRLRPEDVDTTIAAGNALRAAGDLDGAAACCRAALALEPGSSSIANNMANTLCELERFAEALVLYRRSLRRRPDVPEVHNNHGNALLDCGLVGAAAAAYRNAIVLRPDDTEAYANAANALQNARRIAESIASHRRALRLQPDHVVAHSNLLMTMNYASDLTPAAISDAHRRFDRIHAQHLHPQSLHPQPLHADPDWRVVWDPERRIRIGYVSGDFRQHVASCFFEPVLAHHDRARFHVTCYSDTLRPDGVTARLQGLADAWCPIIGWGDAEVADRVRRDGIDVLIDLAGHSGRNRLLVFARKPAPVQATWLGYPNTTGLRAMDYRLVDEITDPSGEADAVASETLLRLPGGFLCFQAPSWAPERCSPPVAPGRPVVFGSFNNLSKVTEAVVETWSAVLRRLPGARLVLKSRPLADAEVRRTLEDAFVGNGVGRDRLGFSGWTGSLGDHLTAYHGIDVALDPFPYNGTTTTCEALWMGVPVVTLRGDRHAARVGASLLTSIGLEELVAADADGYVELAVALAGDRDRLNALKETLRGRMADAPLCDAKGFTLRMEAAVRDAWRRWCDGRAPPGA